RGFDQRVPLEERVFFYLPFEHSETLADQERGLALVGAMGDADLLKWAKLHADIIRRFGRFPHRNALLGRATTPAEREFLDAGGFAGCPLAAGREGARACGRPGAGCIDFKAMPALHRTQSEPTRASPTAARKPLPPAAERALAEAAA